MLPPGKGVGEKQDVGGRGRRSWCLEVPLFPPHTNLQLPSPCPFLTRGLESTQDTPLWSIPHPLGWAILSPPVLLVWFGFVAVVFSLVGTASVLGAPEPMFPVAQPKVWLAIPFPQQGSKEG